MPSLPPTFRTPSQDKARSDRLQQSRLLNDRSRGSAASRGYGSDWRRLRAAHVQQEPLCRHCREQGRIKALDLVDHIIPVEIAPERRLDPTNLQSLCTDCHAAKTAMDMAVYATPGARMDARLLWPNWLRPSAVPLTIVCGAPASGKSTWVRERMEQGDILIDVDAIHRERTGKDGRLRSAQELAEALAVRNQRLGGLFRTHGCKAFFLVGAPGSDERDKWVRLLVPERVVVMETPERECLRRIDIDPERAEVAQWMKRAVQKWWKRYEQREGQETPIKWA